MDALIVIVVMLVEVAIVAGIMYTSIAQRRKGASDAVGEVAAKLKELEELLAEARNLAGNLVDKKQVIRKGREVKLLRESLKTERGRITITQAELETIENRLRELEEIEREVEASGLETKEEITILEKKEKELAAQNKALKEKIASSAQQMEGLLQEINFSAEILEQIQLMKTQLVQTEERIDGLLNEIEQGNEQYFILKKRYDALDIEYAQLFEKFSEAEGAK